MVGVVGQLPNPAGFFVQSDWGRAATALGQTSHARI
jgi:hypothetical protein